MPLGSFPVAALLALLAAPDAWAQPRHLEEWTTVRSPFFEVHSDAATERTHEIATSLEHFRAVLAGLAPEIELRSPAPTRIFVFRDADSYAPYRSGRDADGVMVLGQFLTHPDANYITLNADPSHLGAFSVVFHELVHYLVQNNFPGVPLWFNEGLAEYYSTFRIEGDRVFVGQPVERHARWLARNGELEVDEVLAMTGQGAEGHDAEGAGRLYAVSWALVHYLLSDDTDRSAELAAYFAALTRGEDSGRAFVSILGLRPSELEDAIRAYLAAADLPVAAFDLDQLPSVAFSSGRSEPAEVLAGLGELLAHMGREVEAARHFHLALDYAPESGDAHAGLAYVRDRQQRLAEAEELYRQAMDLGPRSAISYLFYGRHLITLVGGGGLAGDRSDLETLAVRARAALSAATELDPQYGEAWALLGVAHLLPGGDPAAGVGHLERARRLLPGRADVLANLVQLHARAGNEPAARALVEGELGRIGDPEIVLAAREEIERWSLVRSANQALQEGDLERGLLLIDEAISVTTDPELRRELETTLGKLRARLEGR